MILKGEMYIEFRQEEGKVMEMYSGNVSGKNEIKGFIPQIALTLIAHPDITLHCGRPGLQ